jgi:chromosome segregation ATPase
VVYLISQIALFLSLACVLGLALGWLIWGELARRIRTESALRQSKLADLELRHWSALSERDEFEKRVVEREAEITGLRKRILDPEPPEGQVRELQDKLRSAVNEKESVIAQLRARLKEVESQHLASAMSMEERLAASDTRERSLSNHLQELEPRLKESTETIAGLKSQLVEAETQHAAAIQEHVDAVSEKDAQATGLMNRIQHLETLAKDLAAAQNKIRSMDVQQFALMTEQKELRKALAEKDSEIASLTNTFTEHEELDPLQAEIAAKNAALATLQERIQALDQALAEATRAPEPDSVEPLRAEVAALRGRLAELESAAQEGSSVAARKDAALASMQARIQELEQHLAQGTPAPQLPDVEEADLGKLRDLSEILAQPLPHDEVTRLAHSYAAARNFQGGSEHEDWSRAENEVRVRILREKLEQASMAGASAP